MTRASIALLTLAFLGGGAAADCMIVKKNGKLQIWGIDATIGTGNSAIEITPDNIELYSDQSKGVIESDGYDTVTAKKTPTAKAESFPRSEVVRVFYTTDPDGLVNGYAAMATGNYLGAVGDFKQAADDPATREPYRYQALFLIGVCYVNAGRDADCIKHFQAWKPVNAKQTPEVYRILADLLTQARKYDQARAQYEEIGKLPGIPDAWKSKARLGAVKVATAERKYDEAERMAGTIAGETKGRADIVDAHVLALVLQAEAIWRGGKAERLPEAAALLERAAAIDGAEPSTRAFLLVTQGNVLYAQGGDKVEAARFPYMRAALMYPDTGYDGLAYLNAGQCFLDMSARLDGKDQPKSDQCLVSGMKLLAIAAGNYKQADAAKRYRENKKRYDEIMERDQSGAPATPEKSGK